ncbi:ice-binding family protein [Streptomyces lydicus]
MATSVPLGTAATYGVLANTAVTNTGPTVVAGNLGVSPAGAVTGFPPGTVTGTIHVNDAAASQAQADLLVGYANALSQPVTGTVATELGGTTLTPGVYNSLSGTFTLNGTLTLDAQGNPNAVFIFKMTTTLITGAAGNVNLINQAQSANVFWQVGSSATLGAGSTIRGSILAFTSITATTGATVDGRLLALGAAVTLDSNAVTVPPLSTCQVVVQPVAGPVVVGQPTPVSALVTCNGLPVSGASVTFTGGAVPVSATTNAAGIATGSLTFNTAGPATITATVTAAGSGCACTGVVSAPLPITVTPQPSCLVVIQPVAGPVVVGQPTPVSAVVTCNGLPVVGGSVTFTGGAVPVTATTNAAGVATGTLTFNTSGTATVTATVTAAGTACACTGVASAPLTIPVTPATGPLSLAPACWHVNLPIPIPSVFAATLTASVTPAQAGVTVHFFVYGLPVGSAVTNANGIATLNAGLSILQISASNYTATATVGGVPVQATGTLRPCFPPV